MGYFKILRLYVFKDISGKWLGLLNEQLWALQFVQNKVQLSSFMFLKHKVMKV